MKLLRRRILTLVLALSILLGSLLLIGAVERESGATFVENDLPNVDFSVEV